ncbi:hypothetical protein FB567DRAFT_553378 [Paraphoma chrysanthemicola]|uniref:Uncharacterized protein n=1 Tax=Paraphoma chrysanthemicola TaxID=798071 RepID=A0A8K0QX79_9PLEO|nr:hypothetical protein FB567DRAFT_553378 [Paraphoma chrysanthemicola]
MYNKAFSQLRFHNSNSMMSVHRHGDSRPLVVASTSRYRFGSDCPSASTHFRRVNRNGRRSTDRAVLSVALGYIIRIRPVCRVSTYSNQSINSGTTTSQARNFNRSALATRLHLHPSAHLSAFAAKHQIKHSQAAYQDLPSQLSCMAGPKSHQHGQDSKHQRPAGRSQAPKLPAREGKRDQNNPSSKPANIYGKHFDQKPEHAANQAPKRRKEADQARTRHGESDARTEAPTNTDLQRAIQLSHEESLRNWQELAIQLKQIQDAMLTRQMSEDEGLRRWDILSAEMSLLQDTLPQTLLTKTRDIGGPDLRARLTAQHGLDGLSEAEQIQIATLQSRDDAIPADLPRAPAHREDEEFQLAILLSEALEARKQAVETSLAQGQQRDEPMLVQERAVGEVQDGSFSQGSSRPLVSLAELEGSVLFANEAPTDLLQKSQQPIPLAQGKPDRRLTPLPAPQPRLGRGLEWLHFGRSASVASVDGARGASRYRPSAAGSRRSVTSGTTPGTKRPAKSSGHSRKPSELSTNPIAPAPSPSSLPSLITPQSSRSTGTEHRGRHDGQVSTPTPQPSPAVATGSPITNDNDARAHSEQNVVGMAEPVLHASGFLADASMQNIFPNGNQPVIFNGPVTINNNKIVVNEAPARTGSLLKRAVHQHFALGKTKARGAALATSRVASSSNNFLISGLNTIGLGRCRQADESDRFSLGADYDEESRPASPSPTFAAALEETARRVQAQVKAPLQLSRSGCVPGIDYDRGEAVVNRDGSPVPIRSGQLQLLTPRTPSPPSPQMGQSIPARTPSMAISVHGSAASQAELQAPGEGDFYDSAVGMSDASLNPPPNTQNHAQHAPEARHGSQAIREPLPLSPMPVLMHRRPVSNASHGPGATAEEQRQQWPVATPEVDRSGTGTPDSLYAYPDSPAYMKSTLARKHVHPPVNTEWANVPPAGQKLEHINSRAMMDVDRFGHDTRTAMPNLPENVGVRVQADAEGRLTPNTKAKKQEKDLQKKLRAAV